MRTDKVRELGLKSPIPVCTVSYALAREWLFSFSMSAVPLTHNLLLESMPEESRKRLGDAGHIVELQLEDVPFREHEPTPVIFPLDCVISLLRGLEDGNEVEIGMVGPEGFIGVNGVLGVTLNPHTGLTQGRGAALSIATAAVREEMAREPRVAAMLHKFVYTHVTGISQLAACNRLHNVERRLAHWLLLLHDRSGNDTISLTHEFLSRMLATRRASITVAMGALSSAGAIEQARNRVRISDRRQLEAMSCECYESEVRDFENALGFRPNAKKRVSEID